jgi:hypothetical protein
MRVQDEIPRELYFVYQGALQTVCMSEVACVCMYM